MQPINQPQQRVFKTAWFAKAVRKSHIPDEELCRAINEVMQGQADDLGGGVFKKRLNNNQHRSIILAKAGRIWVYEYVFEKKIDRILMTTNWHPSANSQKTIPF